MQENCKKQQLYKVAHLTVEQIPWFQLTQGYI